LNSEEKKDRPVKKLRLLGILEFSKGKAPGRVEHTYVAKFRWRKLFINPRSIGAPKILRFW